MQAVAVAVRTVTCVYHNNLLHEDYGICTDFSDNTTPSSKRRVKRVNQLGKLELSLFSLITRERKAPNGWR
jgi:hypothetical protein